MLCDTLKEVSFPKSLNSIGYDAFKGINIDAVFNVYPKTWPAIFARRLNHFYIGSETFGDFIYETLEDGTVNILEYKGNGETVNIPESIDGHKVTSINTQAFVLHFEIKTVTLPDGITSIADRAFAYLSRLSSINLPESLKFIDDTAFEGVLKDSPIFIVPKQTYAEEWVKTKGFKYQYQ